MQFCAKRTKTITYDVEYDPFEAYANIQSEGIVFGPHSPPLEPFSSLHYHDAVELGYCLKGSGVFTVDSENLPFVAPCVSVLYPGQLHKARSTGEEQSYWIFVTLQAETAFPRQFPLYDRLPWETASATNAIRSDAELCRLMEEILREGEKRELGWDDCIRGLAATLLVRHARLPRETDLINGHAHARRHALQQLQPLLQYIDIHLAEPLTLSHLAAYMHMHPATLRTHFLEAVGVPPIRYLHQVRISAACALLRGTDYPVATIAGEVGYQSLSAFNRHFQERCGLSPTAYRNNEK